MEVTDSVAEETLRVETTADVLVNGAPIEDGVDRTLLGITANEVEAASIEEVDTLTTMVEIGETTEVTVVLRIGDADPLIAVAAAVLDVNDKDEIEGPVLDACKVTTVLAIDDDPLVGVGVAALDRGNGDVVGVRVLLFWSEDVAVELMLEIGEDELEDETVLVVDKVTANEDVEESMLEIDENTFEDELEADGD